MLYLAGILQNLSEKYMLNGQLICYSGYIWEYIFGKRYKMIFSDNYTKAQF